MPSFRPSRDYLLKLTEELIDTCGLSGPFLEIGCGDGAITVALAHREWHGMALDLSVESIEATRECLTRENLSERVQVRQLDFMEFALEQKFKLVILYDVLEHVAQDRAFLAKVRAVLVDGGFLLLSVPVKMKEWRWDDDEYGHLRRYESQELTEMLESPTEGFKIVVQWDISFPVFWILRRMYLAVFSRPSTLVTIPIEERTKRSAFTNAGGKGLLVRASELLPIWAAVYWLQDRFRERFWGCNTLILARAREVGP